MFTINAKGIGRNLNTIKRSKKENISTLSRLFSYLKQNKSMLIAAIGLTVVSNIFNLVSPKFVQKVVSLIEVGVGNVDLKSVSIFCILMLLFYIATYVLSILLSYTMSKFAQIVGLKLRKDCFDKFERLPVSYFDTHQTGDIISRFTYDIDMVSNSIGQTFVSFATSIITLLGSMYMMILTNMTLMMSFFITVPISLFLTMFWTKKVRVFHKDKSKKLGELNGYLEDKITGYKTIKIYGQHKNILKKGIEIINNWGEAHYKAEFYGNNVLRGGLTFVTNTTTALIYTHSCLLLLAGKISLAEISAFILYAKMFTGTVNELTFIIGDVQSSLAGADRVFDFLEEEEERADKEDSINLIDPKGSISIRNVYFSYDENRKILKDITVDMNPGTVTAIVGHTGAGKTTLINLLMRFYHTDKGKILFDGIDIEDISGESLRKSCAMVLQDTWLFSGTIFDNIAYGNESATIEEVIKVSKEVSLHEHIELLPQGYYTVINENSVNISQGQKQLISIARAMLLNSKLLILDEATSNVDTLTEINIQNSMKKLMKGKTSLVIAHRLSTIRNADKVLVLDQGEIIECGTHEELLELNQAYAQLYNAQFEMVELA